MGNDQPVPGEAGFRQPVVPEAEVPEGLDQLTVAAGGHGQDELEPALALVGETGEFVDVLEAEEPAIGHQDHALDRESLQDGREHRLQGLRLGHVAGMDRVQSVWFRHRFEEHTDGQSPGRLHGAEDELPGNAAKGADEAQVLPQLVQREDVAITARGSVGDLGVRRLNPSRGAAETPDESVELPSFIPSTRPRLATTRRRGLPASLRNDSTICR